MVCPKCLSDNVSPVGDDHYICNDPKCVQPDGSRTQFYLVPDKTIRFPYNQIFPNRNVNEFYRKPYLEKPSEGITDI